MKDKVLEILSEACGVEAEDLEMDMNVYEEGLLDSFGTISILVNIETELGIRIEPTEITREDIETPAKLVECVKKRC